MTNKEIITQLQDIKCHCQEMYEAEIKNGDTSSNIWEKDVEALDMAIKALEQQPCEDMEVIQVSKGALKSRQGRFVIYDVDWLKKNFYLEEKIYGQPKQPCEDCISRADVLELVKKGVLVSNNNYQAVCKAINELPSITPQPKRGKWIEDKSGIYHCSNCNEEAYWDTDYGQQRFNYCPECGSDNREEADE